MLHADDPCPEAAIHAVSSGSQYGDDGDDDLFFELSESSDASVHQAPPTTGEPRAAITSTGDITTKAEYGRQPPEFPERHRGASRVQSRPEGSITSQGGKYLLTAGSENVYDLATHRDSLRTSTHHGAAAHSCGDHSPGLLSDRVDASPSSDCAQHAADAPSQPIAGEEGTLETEPQPLDISAAMLPLIPSFPPDSAEVRFRVRSFIIRAVGDTLPSSPYVRFSLHPGAHAIARTAPASNTSSCKMPSWPGGTVGHSPDSRFVEYLFKGEGNGTNGAHVVALPLGSTEAGTARSEEGGAVPSIRLEIVSGRSLGGCDLAFPEAMRRIGGAFRNLTVPIWRRRRLAERCNGSRRSSSAPEGLLPSREEHEVFVGEVYLDLGVALNGQPSLSLSAMNNGAPTELSAGTITVEATEIRVRDAEGRENAGLGARQWGEDVIGVGARLTLEGGQSGVSRFRSAGGGRGRRIGAEGIHHPKSAAVVEGEEEQIRPGGKISLTSTCTELDILALRLVRRGEEDGGLRGSGGVLGLGIKNGDRGRWGERETVTIAVSDINELFDGRPRWVAMARDCLEREGGNDGPETNCSKKTTRSPGHGTRKAGRQVEVKLLVTLAGVAPVHHHERCRRESAGEGPPVRGLVPPQNKPGPPPTGPHAFQDMRVTQAEESQAGLGVPCSALEAWITSPRSGCAQALAAVPSLGDGTGSARPTPHRSNRRTMPRSIENGGNCLSQVAGPGIFALEILAVCGRGHEPRVDGGREASSTQSFPPWWVRVKIPNGGQGRDSDAPSIDSPAGVWSMVDGDGIGRVEAAIIDAPPPQRREAGRRGFDWVVCWPRSGGVLASCPVHWTLSQSELPVVFLEVFRGQVRFSTISNFGCSYIL